MIEQGEVARQQDAHGAQADAPDTHKDQIARRRTLVAASEIVRRKLYTAKIARVPRRRRKGAAAAQTARILGLRLGRGLADLHSGEALGLGQRGQGEH